MKLQTRGVIHDLPQRPLVMGIVNLVNDSFSGDGLEDIDAAMAHARALLREGADIIDIGAESARTNRQAISGERESAQLLLFIERWREVHAPFAKGQGFPLLSINTWRPGVVRAVLPFGGDLLNDIGGLPTSENAEVCASTGAALGIMHTVGEPKIPHTHVAYGDVMAVLDEFFSAKMAIAEAAGVSRNAIVLDPGIDFAKQRADNLCILRELARLRSFDRPILLPVSRKTVIGDVLDLPEARSRDAGTVACVVSGVLSGAAIVRVHNVRAAVQAIRIVHAVIAGADAGNT